MSLLGAEDVWPHSKDVWTVQSPSGPQWVTWPSKSSVAWIRLSGQRLEVSTLRSTLCFSSRNTFVSIPHGNYEFRWIVHDMEVKHWEPIIGGETYPVVPIPSCFSLIVSSFAKVPIKHNVHTVACNTCMYIYISNLRCQECTWKIFVEKFSEEPQLCFTGLYLLVGFGQA